MPPLKVVLAAPRLPPSYDGVGDHAHALARALASMGHALRVLTCGNAGECDEYSTIRLGRSWGAAATLKACMHLLRTKPDALLVEYTPFLYGSHSVTPIVLAALARASGIPCTVIVHEIFYESGTQAIRSPSRARYFAARDRILLNAARRIAATNEQRRTRILSRLPQLAGRVDLVPIAANVEPAPGAKASPYVSGEGPLELVVFGVVMPRRRYELAIEALAHVRQTRGARLSIVGRICDAEYAQACIAHARKHGVADHVSFTGSLEPHEISQRLLRSHIALHTTVEGSTRSSGSLLALLAHGLPVVAARTVDDDRCFDEIVVRSEPNARAIGETVARLSGNRVESAAIGRRAADSYANQFDWRSLATSLLQYSATAPRFAAAFSQRKGA